MTTKGPPETDHLQPRAEGSRCSFNAARARRVLGVAAGERPRALVVAGLLVGLRPGELTGLLWSDLEYESPHVVGGHVVLCLSRPGPIDTLTAAAEMSRPGLYDRLRRLGLRPLPPSISPDITDVYCQLGNVDAVAAHYNTSPITAARWLRSVGVTLRSRR